MRRILIPLALAAILPAAPASAKPAFPLEPFGLPYAPEAPQPVVPDHPLYRRVALAPIAAMPEKVGGLFTPVTSAVELNEALRAALDRANMLAPAGAPAKFTLAPSWIALDAPKKISFSSEASVTLGYALTRIDRGQLLFERRITTATSARGGDAGERFKGNARLAIVANLASALRCLDRAAFGRAPADCALTVGAKFQAPQPPMIQFLPRL